MAEILWRGVIAPLNKADAAGRKIRMAGAPYTRRLPLPLRYQDADYGAHNEARSVGNIERVWIEGSSLWGEGRFDVHDPYAQQVIRKIRNGFVRHMSADIIYEPKDRLAGATIVDIPAFEDAEIKELRVADGVEEEKDEEEVDRQYQTVEVAAFRVVGDMDLPLASRGREWDSSAATRRVGEWAGGDDLDPARYRRAFFYQDEDSDPSLKGSYKLPFADVIDGRLTAVPRAIFAVAGVLEGARGGVDIPDSDKETIRRRVSAWYRRMADVFDDSSLVAPWDREESMSSDDDESFGGLHRVKARFAAASVLLD